MAEYCNLLQLILLLCLLAYNSVFATGNELRCIEKERQALLEFKKGLIDEHGFLSSWGSEEHKRECCRWQGIECSHHSGHVIALQLSTCDLSMQLKGDNISSALLELKYLTHLDISCNGFGKFPDFIGSMEKLQYLNFHRSYLSGVVRHQLANLTNLRKLDLGDNFDLEFDSLHWLSRFSSLSLLDLSGNNLTDHANSLRDMLNLPSLKELYLSGCYSFPTSFSVVNSSSTSLSILDLSMIGLTSSSFHWLFNISTSLRSLDLSGSEFESNIPSDFGKFAFLEHLALSFGRLGGGIPKSFGNLSVLQTLDLSHNQLTGGIPKSFGNLSLLQTLDLSSNQLTGGIPKSFGNLSVLQTLDLSYNQLTGGIPKSFGNLSVLQTLGLSYNQLRGGIPKCFGNLSHLQTLKLSDNSLSESLPELFYNLCAGAMQSLEILELQGNNLFGSVPDVTCLPSLRILQLQNNQLSGHFPLGFVHISKLDVLDLSGNRIRGSVPDLSAFVSLRELHLGRNKLTSLPTSLWQLSMLEILDLSFNSISGTISEIHLSKLHNLKRLYLSFNLFAFNFSDGWIPPFQLDVITLVACNIGPHFPTWLRTQTNLFQLDLSYNAISEEVPKWLWNFSPRIDHLNLSHNEIMGSIPDLSSMNYRTLDISCNNFSGPLPLPPHDSLEFLLLSNNMFVGSISSICTTSYLYVLDLSNNQFSGELPDCWENKTYLEILNLSNNNFSGSIPHSLGSLSGLKMLHLRNNNFSGELPSTLMNCSDLQMLDVGGNNLRGKIPAWIGTYLQNLKILSLGPNNFSGNIPTEICHLIEIQILDLSRNFLSGKLPQCFNNFTSLIQKDATFRSLVISYYFDGFHVDAYMDHVFIQWKQQQAEYGKARVGLVKLIDFSSNKLVGNIPNELSQLRALISLNLSGNYLSGHIIPNIGEMEMLEILDLSKNNFSGEIPKSLAKLNWLAVLNLSNNHLSGKIPSSTQLQSFETSTYAANNGLCGPPLTRCPGDEPNPFTGLQGKQENVDDGFIAQLHSHEFYIPIIMGFIVGFWGIVGTLALKNSWRYAYFNFFSSMGDWLYVPTMIYAGKLKRSLRNNVPY